MSLSLEEIATLVGGTRHGDSNPIIHSVAAIEEAGDGDLAALQDLKLLGDAAISGASALLVSPQLETVPDKPHVLVNEPLVAMNRVIEHLKLLPPLERPPRREQTRLHPSACVHPDAVVGEGCDIGPFAVVGAGAHLGAGTVLRSHAVVEDGAYIGENCDLHPHSVIGSSTRIGHHVVIGANAVLAASGFAFGESPIGAERYHHVGRVEVGDHAEIGPGCTVDRARFGLTRIGTGAKLDAHCHIAHNCSVGDHTIMAAQVGLAGSSHIGAGCLIGGQAGIAGHLKIADGCKISARAGVPGDLKKSATYFGYWAKERKVAFRELAAAAKLPQALRELRKLQERVRQLEAAGGSMENSTEDSTRDV